MNIEEGAEFRSMPQLFGFGRIKPRAQFDTFSREHYVTLRMFGWRLFVAWAKYDKKHMSFRHWIARDR
jgi:hypothetical protein